MNAEGRPRKREPEQDYRTLPPGVSREETIASVGPDAVPDPDSGRNVDQHRALKDD
jgi:hypothetical protein